MPVHVISCDPHDTVSPNDAVPEVMMDATDNVDAVPPPMGAYNVFPFPSVSTSLFAVALYDELI